MLMTSPWGIGILKWRNQGLTSVMAGADGTLFGAWRYNRSTDVVQGIGDFNADARDDILLGSPSAIGVLTLHGSTLTSLMSQPKDAWFGGWRYNPQDNVVEGIADFNGDGQDDILMTSPWGIGVFTLQDSTLTPLMAQPNGAWFGAWRYNRQDNVLEGIGDLNGDGRDELLLSSPWGMAALKLQGSTLTTILVRPKGTWFGGWCCNPDNDAVAQVADFNGDGRDDLLMSSPWGIGVLTLAGDTLTSLDMTAYDYPVGAWYLTAADRVCGVVRLDGGHGSAIVLKK